MDEAAPEAPADGTTPVLPPPPPTIRMSTAPSAWAPGFNPNPNQATAYIAVSRNGTSDDQSAMTDLTSRLTDVTSRVSLVETTMNKVLDICSRLLERDQQRNDSQRGEPTPPLTNPLATGGEPLVALVP